MQVRVDAASRARSGDDAAVLHVEHVDVQVGLGKAPGQLGAVAPVRRAATPLEQPGEAETERGRAGGHDRGSARVVGAQGLADPGILHEVVALGCHGHVQWLRRTWSGPFDAEDGISLDTIDRLARTEELEGFLLPMGGHKGYGLAVMVDLLAGLLSGAAYLTHVQAWDKNPEAAQNLGHVFILIDTTKLHSADWMRERMADFGAILRDTPAADPAQPVMAPGDREMALYARSKRDGVTVATADLDALQTAPGEA